jgi:AmmeMemoRadiSam system protein B
MPHTRPPAVAGMFYPADARQLAGDVDAMLAAAAGDAEHSPPGAARHQSAASQRSSGYPKALIVPHAGYRTIAWSGLHCVAWRANGASLSSRPGHQR